MPYKDPEKNRLQYERRKKAGYFKDYNRRNKEKVAATSKKWYEDNKELVLTREKERMQSDPSFKALKRMRSRMNKCVARNKKADTTIELIGCTLDFLRDHLESMFQPGMSWDNYGFGKGKWVVDHIVPLSIFPDLSLEWQQRSAFNWQNLQPLWWEDNMAKGNKLEVCPV